MQVSVFLRFFSFRNNQLFGSQIQSIINIENKNCPLERQINKSLDSLNHLFEIVFCTEFQGKLLVLNLEQLILVDEKEAFELCAFEPPVQEIVDLNDN